MVGADGFMCAVDQYVIVVQARCGLIEVLKSSTTVAD